MDTQQIFHNLATKFLKPHLAKENLESHLEGLTSGITFFKNADQNNSEYRHFPYSDIILIIYN